MPAYKYTALNDKGRQVKGVLEAENPKSLRAILKERKLVPV